MLRSFMVVVLAVSGGVVLPDGADARGKRVKAKRAAVERAAAPQSARDSSDAADCIRARSQDPAGNYRDYPCWARAALSGTPRR
jgi:hypothetical protein